MYVERTSSTANKVNYDSAQLLPLKNKKNKCFEKVDPNKGQTRTCPCMRTDYCPFEAYARNRHDSQFNDGEKTTTVVFLVEVPPASSLALGPVAILFYSHVWLRSSKKYKISSVFLHRVIIINKTYFCIKTEHACH